MEKILPFFDRYKLFCGILLEKNNNNNESIFEGIKYEDGI
jgi:hypothetical protein